MRLTYTFRLRTSIALLMLLLGNAVSAQSQNQDGASGHNASINLLATVRDKHGKIVATLTKDDFVLTQDDRPQVIQSSTKESDLPLTIGLVFDTGMNQAGALDRERSASHDFLDRILRENKDKAFIIHFDSEVELLQDITNSRDKLFNALGLLQAARPGFQSAGDSGEAGENRQKRGHGSVLYDAVFLACDELMKTQGGRKVLIVISDGIDRHSKETVGSTIESAQRADTLVFNIMFKDEEPAPEHRGFGFPGGGGMGRPRGGSRPQVPQETPADAKKILDQVSKATGGAVFEISRKQPIDQTYHTIEDDLQHQYAISYTPEQSGDSSGYHKILLTTKQKDLVVQAKEGFYAGK